MFNLKVNSHNFIFSIRSVAAAERLKARLAAGGKATEAGSESESDDDERPNAGKKNKGKGAQQKTKKPEPQLIFQVILI